MTLLSLRDLSVTLETPVGAAPILESVSFDLAATFNVAAIAAPQNSAYILKNFHISAMTHKNKS